MNLEVQLSGLLPISLSEEKQRLNVDFVRRFKRLLFLSRTTFLNASKNAVRMGQQEKCKKLLLPCTPF